MASKPSKPRTLAPGVYPVIEHVSPDIRDTIFYIDVDSRLAKYKLPEYGSRYVGPRGHLILDPWGNQSDEPVGRFDSHELVHVTLADERGMVRWYYARTREDQAIYNWSYNAPGITKQGYDSYTRIYIEKRSTAAGYTVSTSAKYLGPGDPDPDEESTPQFEGFVHTGTELRRIDDVQLDSLYILVSRTFERLCTRTDDSFDEVYGQVRTTTEFEARAYDLNGDIIPRTQHALGASYIIPFDAHLYEDEDESLHPNVRIIDIKYVFSNCDREHRRADITTALFPTPVMTSLTDDDRFCTIETQTFIDEKYYEVIHTSCVTAYGFKPYNAGDGYGELNADEEYDFYVLSYKEDNVIAPNLVKIAIQTVALPSEPSFSKSEDDTYCALQTETYYTHRDKLDLPDLGQIRGTGAVIDITEEDINCGGILKVSIVTGVVPSPTKVSERTDDDQCRIVTESFVDLNSYQVPVLDTAHPTDTTLKVVDTSYSPLGCRGVSDYTITYAVIPTPPRDSERDDTTYGRVIDYTFYDLVGATALPVIGTAYGSGIVIDAQANDVNCGGLRRYVVSVVAALPIIKDSTSHDETYCDLLTQVRIDTEAYIPPALGTVGGSGIIIDVNSREISPGGLLEYTITSGVIPSPIRVSERTDDDQCRIVTEESVQLDTFVLPAIDTQHGTDTTLRVVNTEETPRGCRGIKNTSVTYAVIPSLPRDTEREDDRWGRITEYTFYDLEGSTLLPAIGSEYAGRTVISAVAQDVNCGTLRRYVVGTVTLPTAKRYEHREDDLYCGIEKEIYIDFSTHVLPSLGGVYGSGSVIDLEATDLNLGGITQFTITSGVVPSPRKTSQRTDDEQCIILTDTYVDLDTVAIPALDSAHPDSPIENLKVVNTNVTPLGCRGISNIEVTYAVTPSPSRQKEREDDEWGRVTEYTTYDLEGAYPLPSLGPTGTGTVVVTAVAEDVNCGTLRRYVVTEANIPSAKLYTRSEDERFCTLETETFYDLDTYIPPAKGSTYNQSMVLDVTSRDINIGGVTQFSITTGTVPTPVKTRSRTDDDLCQVITESFAHNAYQVPALDSGHPTLAGFKVVNTEETPYGCGGIFSYDITYAQIPSPAKTDLIEDSEYGTITVETFFVNDQYELPALGDAYGIGYILAAKKNEVNCGTLIKVELRYAAIPTLKRYTDREDPEFCLTEEQTYYDLESSLLPGAGTLFGTGYVLDASKEDIDLGQISKYTIRTAVMPTPTKESERKDDDKCVILTESFYHTDTIYTAPVISTAHPTKPLLKLINKEVSPYACGGIRKFTNTYAEIPTPPRTSEYDHPEYCRVSVDTFYDYDDNSVLPALGDSYDTGTVVEAKAIDVDCEGLRKYEVHYVTLPYIKEETVEDDTYCQMTRHITYTATATFLPTQGDLQDGKYVIEADEKYMGCDVIKKQTLMLTTLPSTINTSTSDNAGVYGTVAKDIYYDLSTVLPPAIKSPRGLGVVVDRAVTPLGCGTISKFEVSTALIPAPAVFSVNTDSKYCTTRVSRQIIDVEQSLDYELGATTTDTSVVVDYSLEPVKGGQHFANEVVTTVASLPAGVRNYTRTDDRFCNVEVETFSDLETSAEDLVEGDARGVGYVVGYEKKTVCGDLVDIKIEVAVLPTETKATAGSDPLFCQVTNNEFYDLTANLPQLTRGDEHEGLLVIDYEVTPYGCGTISRLRWKTGVVPSSALEGHRLNQLTGKLETYSKKVVKNGDVGAEKRDVDEQGTFVSIEAYGCGLSLAEEATIKPFDTLTYNTTVNYSFPRVLQSVDLFVWALRKGGTEIYPQLRWKRVAYSGPCEAEITETWHFMKPAVQQPVVLEPTSLNYSSPLYSIGTPPCLHTGATFRCDFGTSHKKYALSANSSFTINATTYTDWPTQPFLAAWTCRPANGGFIERTVMVKPPAQ